MNRGSEWRQWDLHVHTPGTKKNDQFGDASTVWDDYISALEATDIAVFGITDYFSIDNYLRVKEYQNAGRLRDKYILPNVELRIEPITRTETPINIHVLFDPALSEDDIKREFLSKLSFKYRDAEYSCVNEQLRDLGRAFVGNPTLEEAAAIKEGVNQFVVSYQQLRDLVEKEFFKNRIIIAVSNSNRDGNSGYQTTDGALKATREEVYRMSDIIFSGNPRDVEFFLGKKTSPQEVLDTFGSLKPCVIGSDAHKLDNVGVYPNNRITWIKADPSFEGLKQILFEPEERVRISEIQPDKKYDYHVIDSIQLNTAGIWGQTIYFNPNLNTIIGGRSTGKSTLLSSIASKFVDTSGWENVEFINRLSDTVHVHWADGQESDDKMIEFFPQNHISKIADTDYSDKLLLDIMLNDSIRKLAYEKFNTKLASQRMQIQSQVLMLFEKRRILQEKQVQVKQLGDAEGVKREITKMLALQNEMQAKIVDKKELLDAFVKTEESINAIKVAIQSRMTNVDTLRILMNQNFIVPNNTLSLSGITNDIAEKIGVATTKAINAANTTIKDIIANLILEEEKFKSEQLEKIASIQKTDDYKSGKDIFDANKNLVAILKEISVLKERLEQITKGQAVLQNLHDEYKTIGGGIIDMHLEYLDVVNEIATQMQMQHEDVLLTSTVRLKEALNTTLVECISMRSAAMNEFVESTVKGYGKMQKADVRETIREVINRSLKGELSFKGGYDAQSFISKILADCWYTFALNVQYDGDNLKDMSPGKRSFVILKLLLDFNDKKWPILIDQPEDNLDNRAIYQDLVQYIRKKKKERQIILVTHNPNIVVGADAEEVIVANQNGKNSPNTSGIKFEYISGGLDNSRPVNRDTTLPMLNRCGIRQHVCDILEGGEQAFQDRENKYGFRKI